MVGSATTRARAAPRSPPHLEVGPHRRRYPDPRLGAAALWTAGNSGNSHPLLRCSRTGSQRPGVAHHCAIAWPMSLPNLDAGGRAHADLIPAMSPDSRMTAMRGLYTTLALRRCLPGTPSPGHQVQALQDGHGRQRNSTPRTPRAVHSPQRSAALPIKIHWGFITPTPLGANSHGRNRSGSWPQSRHSFSKGRFPTARGN
jgi:hypothetical protein